jgi:CRP-like cAMP-binding protein
LKTTLQSIPLFANVNETQIIDICREVEIKELERDILLYDTGDKIEDLFIILHGHVSCSISFVSGLDLSESPPFVDTMRENDFFGEGAVLYDEIAPSRLQYFTPKDIKVVVLSISANKLKPFLPQCPILQLRFEERLLVRKTHMDLIDTLVNAIAASLSTRYAYAPSSRRSKKSLGHIADTTAKETISMNDEVVYLRDEVKRLNGVQYPDARKERSHSKALSTFKSTLQKLKSSLPSSNALHNSAPKVPERKKKPVRRTKEAEFAAKDAHSPFFRHSQESGSSSDDNDDDDDDRGDIVSQSSFGSGDDDISSSSDSLVELLFSSTSSTAAQLAAIEALNISCHSDKESGKNASKELDKKKSNASSSSVPAAVKDEPILKRTVANEKVSSSKKNLNVSAKKNLIETGETPTTSGTFVTDAMYDRMLKMKLPESAIRKKMMTDGVPPEAIDNLFQQHGL